MAEVAWRLSSANVPWVLQELFAKNVSAVTKLSFHLLEKIQFSNELFYTLGEIEKDCKYVLLTQCVLRKF